jgi:hypothetical protein
MWRYYDEFNIRCHRSYFSWSGELNMKNVIKTLHKYSCITDGKKENTEDSSRLQGEIYCEWKFGPALHLRF